MKQLIQFQNEYYFEEVEMDMSEFVQTVTIDNITFGCWGGIYIAIKDMKV